MNRQEKVEAFDIYLAKHKGCLTPEQENRYIDLIVEARSNHSEEEGQEQEEPLPLELLGGMYLCVVWVDTNVSRLMVRWNELGTS